MHAIWEEERERKRKAKKSGAREKILTRVWSRKKNMTKDKCYDNQHSEQRQKVKV
jgi:hypothetical protein